MQDRLALPFEGVLCSAIVRCSETSKRGFSARCQRLTGEPESHLIRPPHRAAPPEYERCRRHDLAPSPELAAHQAFGWFREVLSLHELIRSLSGYHREARRCQPVEEGLVESRSRMPLSTFDQRLKGRPIHRVGYSLSLPDPPTVSR